MLPWVLHPVTSSSVPTMSNIIRNNLIICLPFSNDYTSGVFSLHCLSPEVAAKEEVMEFRFIHESKLEGTQYMGNQVASERLVLFYSVPNHDVFQKVSWH